MADTAMQAALRAAFNSKVSVNAQSLTDEQKAQVRTNIGAADPSLLVPRTETASRWGWSSDSDGNVTMEAGFSVSLEGGSSAIRCRGAGNSLISSNLQLYSDSGDGQAVQLAGYQKGAPATFSQGYGDGTLYTESTLTVDTPDIFQIADDMSVPDGAQVNGIRPAWIKTGILSTTARTSISLGSSWEWLGGSAPDLTNVSSVTFFWTGTKGIANPHTLS